MIRAVLSYGMPEGHASVPECLLVRWRSKNPLVRHLVLSQAEGKFTFSERTILGRMAAGVGIAIAVHTKFMYAPGMHQD